MRKGNRKTWKTTGLCLFLCITLATPMILPFEVIGQFRQPSTVKASTKAKKVTKSTELQADKNYYYDIDGDEKNEMIRWTFKSNDQYDESGNLILEIDGKKVYKKKLESEGGLWFHVQLCNIKKSDKYAEICINAGGIDEVVLFTKFYRYNKKEKKLKGLKAIGKKNRIITAHPNLITMKGNGEILVWSGGWNGDGGATNVLGCFMFQTVYKLKGNKIVVSSAKKHKFDCWMGKTFRYIPKKKFKVYQKASTKSQKVFTLEKGTKIRITKIKWKYIGNPVYKLSGYYLYIKTNSGKKGWIHITKEMEKKYDFKDNTLFTSNTGYLPAWQ